MSKGFQVFNIGLDKPELDLLIQVLADVAANGKFDAAVRHFGMRERGRAEYLLRKLQTLWNEGTGTQGKPLLEVLKPMLEDEDDDGAEDIPVREGSW